jgi:hypothetical protein
MNYTDKIFEKIYPFFIGGMFIFTIGVIIAAPAIKYISAANFQKSINAQCGTDYSVVDVLFNGERLTSLCQIKNQQITVK